MQYTEEQLFNKCIKYMDSIYNCAKSECTSKGQREDIALQIVGLSLFVCNLLKKEDYIEKIQDKKDTLVLKLLK